LTFENLQESSSLYAQRLTLFNDPEINWLDIEDFEDRFEPHIDGLVVGEELALEVCKQQATEGDFGELHAAVRVFCRQKRLDLLNEVLGQLDFEDPEKVKAVSDALNHELPEEWREEFVGKLGDPKLTPMVARLIGYRRISEGPRLLEVLETCSPESIIPIIRALGRLREPKARVPLFNQYLQHDDEAIRKEAALALLRLGEKQTIDYCIQRVKSEDWASIPLGLGGTSAAVPVLLQAIASRGPSQDSLLALGLLGEISVVDSLLSHIPKAEAAESAAMALNLITGAELYEEVFIPEKIDEDELFEEEVEKLKRGEPLYPPGKEPGITITRLSQKPEEWTKWWSENKSRFRPNVRYRNGKPYSPACLLENLESEKSRRIVRDLAYEELVIRYGLEYPFETDMTVVQQRAALSKYATWIQEHKE
jgi:uncharacterized protein (TIGR02270 family)